jgi:hypothetical protein
MTSETTEEQARINAEVKRDLALTAARMILKDERAAIGRLTIGDFVRMAELIVELSPAEGWLASTDHRS